MQPDQELLVEELIAENIFVKAYREAQSPHLWPLLPFMKEAKESINEMVSIIKK